MNIWGRGVTLQIEIIFRDLDFVNPEEWQVKARLASETLESIQSHGWSREEASNRLGISHDELLHIQQGQFDRFSIEWLTRRGGSTLLKETRSQ